MAISLELLFGMTWFSDTIFLGGMLTIIHAILLVSASWYHYNASGVSICIPRVCLGSKGVNSLTVIQTMWKNTPFVFHKHFQCSHVLSCDWHGCPVTLASLLWKNSFLRSMSSLLKYCHHDVLWNVLRCGLFHKYLLLHSNMLLLHC